MSIYDSLRRECRTLESLLDTKLTSYSRLAANLGVDDDVEASGSQERWADLEEEVDGLLEKASYFKLACSHLAHILPAQGHQ